MDPRAGRAWGSPSPTRSPSRRSTRRAFAGALDEAAELTADGAQRVPAGAGPSHGHALRPADLAAPVHRLPQLPRRCGTSRSNARVAALRDPETPVAAWSTRSSGRATVPPRSSPATGPASTASVTRPTTSPAPSRRSPRPPSGRAAARGGRARLAARGRRQGPAVRSARLLRRPGPRGDPRDDQPPGVGGRPVRRRRALRAHLRRVVPHLPAHPLDPRPHAGRAPAPRAGRAQADRRHGAGLRAHRPGHARARARRPT